MSAVSPTGNNKRIPDNRIDSADDSSMRLGSPVHQAYNPKYLTRSTTYKSAQDHITEHNSKKQVQQRSSYLGTLSKGVQRQSSNRSLTRNDQEEDEEDETDYNQRPAIIYPPPLKNSNIETHRNPQRETKRIVSKHHDSNSNAPSDTSEDYFDKLCHVLLVMGAKEPETLAKDSLDVLNKETKKLVKAISEGKGNMSLVAKGYLDKLLALLEQLGVQSPTKFLELPLNIFKQKSMALIEALSNERHSSSNSNNQYGRDELTLKLLPDLYKKIAVLETQLDLMTKERDEAAHQVQEQLGIIEEVEQKLQEYEELAIKRLEETNSSGASNRKEIEEAIRVVAEQKLHVAEQERDEAKGQLQNCLAQLKVQDSHLETIQKKLEEEISLRRESIASNLNLSSSKDELQKVKETFEEELHKKDNVIKELNQKLSLLMSNDSMAFSPTKKGLGTPGQGVLKNAEPESIEKAVLQKIRPLLLDLFKIEKKKITFVEAKHESGPLDNIIAGKNSPRESVNKPASLKPNSGPFLRVLPPPTQCLTPEGSMQDFSDPREKGSFVSNPGKGTPNIPSPKAELALAENLIGVKASGDLHSPILPSSNMKTLAQPQPQKPTPPRSKSLEHRDEGDGEEGRGPSNTVVANSARHYAKTKTTVKDKPDIKDWNDFLKTLNVSPQPQTMADINIDTQSRKSGKSGKSRDRRKAQRLATQTEAENREMDESFDSRNGKDVKTPKTRFSPKKNHKSHHIQNRIDMTGSRISEDSWNDGKAKTKVKEGENLLLKHLALDKDGAKSVSQSFRVPKQKLESPSQNLRDNILLSYQNSLSNPHSSRVRRVESDPLQLNDLITQLRADNDDHSGEELEVSQEAFKKNKSRFRR
jgi:hypothetical protein